MEKEFIPYTLAVKLKELGFDEPCFAWYDGRYPSSINQDYCKNSEEWLNTIHCATPTFSQAFRWLRHKHNCVCEIIRKEDGNHSEFIGWVYIDGRKIDVVSYWDSKSYEEAELACLIKLIEIVKNK
jgi:hypothetical protein